MELSKGSFVKLLRPGLFKLHPPPSCEEALQFCHWKAPLLNCARSTVILLFWLLFPLFIWWNYDRVIELLWLIHAIDYMEKLKRTQDSGWASFWFLASLCLPLEAHCPLFSTLLQHVLRNWALQMTSLKLLSYLFWRLAVGWFWPVGGTSKGLRVGRK